MDAIDLQNMKLLLSNAHIYYNYDEVVAKYNSDGRDYISSSKDLYFERVLHLLEQCFAGKSEKEIRQIIVKACLDNAEAS